MPIFNSSKIFIVISTAWLVLIYIFIHPFFDPFSQDLLSWKGLERISTFFTIKKDCDIFQGKWIQDPTAPHYYTNLTCSIMDEQTNCMRWGRPDTDFIKWRWKPDGCDLPSFDPTMFFDLMQGKSMVFIGDSLGRNQMHSLICILSKVARPEKIENNFHRREFQSYWYPEYNITFATYFSPFLVKAEAVDTDHITLDSPFKLYLDEPDDTWLNAVESFDYVIVAVGAWFFRPNWYYENNQLVGCNFCEDKNISDVSLYYAFKYVFRTTFQTLQDLPNYTGTTVLSTITPQHFENGAWKDGGVCNRRNQFRINETQPLLNLHQEILGLHKSQLEEFQKMAEENIQRYLLLDNIRVLSLRPDGHPSIYNPKKDIKKYYDCVHWCLPGPMDNVNDLFLYLLKRNK